MCSSPPKRFGLHLILKHFRGKKEKKKKYFRKRVSLFELPIIEQVDFFLKFSTCRATRADPSLHPAVSLKFYNKKPMTWKRTELNYEREKKSNKKCSS